MTILFINIDLPIRQMSKFFKNFYSIIIFMKNIAFVFGTRPEIIKLAPVILEMKKYPDFYNTIIINTEQQKELSNQTLKYFNLKADYNLNSMRENQSLASVQTRILSSLDEVYSNNKIDGTIVQGDTMTVLCGALTSFYHKIPVFHVEAGLRSYDKYEPFPEEIIRQMTSRIADIHFAPTEVNKKSLLSEGINENKIHIVGNTVIDALFCLSDEILNNSKKFYEEKNIDINDKLVLVTAHRRENHGERIDKIIDAVLYLAKKYTDHSFIIPVHPNPNVHEKIYSRLGMYNNIKLLPPLDYPYLVYLMKNAKLILTDSGGIQEEAPSFACPTLVMRYETERKEGIEAGVSKLVGADFDKIVLESEKILSSHKSTSRLRVSNPYGDGQASIRIEKIVKNYFS